MLVQLESTRARKDNLPVFNVTWENLTLSRVPLDAKAVLLGCTKTARVRNLARNVPKTRSAPRHTSLVRVSASDAWQRKQREL